LISLHTVLTTFSSKIYLDLMKELEVFEYSLQRSHLLIHTIHREAQNYETLFQEKGPFFLLSFCSLISHHIHELCLMCCCCCLENEIQQVRNEITSLKQKLEEQRKIRKYREEYDTFSKIVNEHPSRTATKRSFIHISNKHTTHTLSLFHSFSLFDLLCPFK
jgi:hypothetical protein